MSDCLFCRIIKREIPANILYEDEELLAFHDIRPAAKVHFLIIPKRHIRSLQDVQPGDETILGKILAKAPELAQKTGLAHGFKTSINTGPGGGQEVYHLHVHILGGGPRS